MSDHDVESGREAEGEPATEYARRKRRIVIMLLVYSAIIGVLSYYLPEENAPLDFLVGAPVLILGLVWCFTDAAQHKHRIGGPMRVLLVVAFIVGLPIYLLQTRGIDAPKSLVLALLLLMAMLSSMFAAGLGTMYLAEFAVFG
jgi:hypothetical protein